MIAHRVGKNPLPGRRTEKTMAWGLFALVDSTYPLLALCLTSFRQAFAPRRARCSRKEGGETTDMFDLGQQGETAVVAEAGPVAGERALMRAVLEDAIRGLIGEGGPRHPPVGPAPEARGGVRTAEPPRALPLRDLGAG